MDTEALISAICARVLEKVSALEEAGQGKDLGSSDEASEQCQGSGKPKILILTEKHGEICHETLENQILAKEYKTECALLAQGTCKAGDYEAIVVYTLSNEALGKLAAGIFDSDFTRIFGEALLLGKKILVAREGVELFAYKDTAPKAYFDRLAENLELLEKSGVILTPHSRMAALLTGTETEAGAEKGDRESPEQKKQDNTAPCQEEEMKKKKKVITERDMAAIKEKKISRILVGEKTIFTDLAREYASRYGISVRRDTCPEKKGE